MKQISGDQFFEKIAKMGLVYSDKTGGQLMEGLQDAKVKKIQDNHFNIIHETGERSVIVDPILFHHSVLTAEQTLDIRFFS